MAEMNHQTDTPSFISVPSHTRLFHREGGTYYFRAKVPKNIRHIIGKTEIRKSLRTKDPKEGRQKVKIESVRVDAQFAAAERKLTTRAMPVCTLSDEEIDHLVSKYFVKLEQQARRMFEHEVESLPTPYEREDAAAEISENLKIDNMVLHQTGGYEWCDNHSIVDNFLAEEVPHLDIPKGSQTYNSLFVRLKRAISENQVRTIDTLEGREIKPGTFGNLGPDSVIPSLAGKQFSWEAFLMISWNTNAEGTPKQPRPPINSQCGSYAR